MWHWEVPPSEIILLVFPSPVASVWHLYKNLFQLTNSYCFIKYYNSQLHVPLLRLVCHKARKHCREKDYFLFNFLAAMCLNIVTQSTMGSIKTHLSLQSLKMNSYTTFCISCLQERGKRFLSNNGKKKKTSKLFKISL